MYVVLCSILYGFHEDTLQPVMLYRSHYHIIGNIGCQLIVTDDVKHKILCISRSALQAGSKNGSQEASSV